MSAGTAPLDPTGAENDTFQTSDASGQAFDVQLTAVIDPATPTGSSSVPPGSSRLVAVRLVITNPGPAAVVGDADVAATLVGSDRRAWGAVTASVAGCAPFPNGEFQLRPSSQASGCVIFAVPTAAEVAAVRFVPAGGGLAAEWSAA